MERKIKDAFLSRLSLPLPAAIRAERDFSISGALALWRLLFFILAKRLFFELILPLHFGIFLKGRKPQPHPWPRPLLLSVMLPVRHLGRLGTTCGS